MTAIYKNYDQAALDRQYNNRAMVPDFATIAAQWQADSEALRQVVTAHLKVAYGDHQREILDIFPAGRPEAPVLVFFHGGYWQAMDSSVFHFIARDFVVEDVTTVLVNYPLAPEAAMDDIIAACRRSLIWLSNNMARYGGDPADHPPRLYLAGHSAGGHIVTMLMSTEWQKITADLSPPIIQGGCAISGLFNLLPIQLSYINQKIGMDETDARRNSPIFLTPTGDAPLIAAVGALESEEYHAQARQLSLAWAAKGLIVSEMIIPGSNHFSILETLTDKSGAIHQAILNQING